MTAVTLALPEITSYYQTDLNQSQWILSSYFVATAIALPIAGKCADLFKRKDIYILGFAVYTIGSLFSALSPNLSLLIASRILMGFGSASLLANTNVITISVFSYRLQGIALGFNNSVFSLGFALGYLPGGWLIEHWGWQSIFYINLPIGICACFLAWYILKENLISRHHYKNPSHRFDFLGGLLSIIAIGALLLGFEEWISEGFSLLAIFYLGLTLCGFALFIFQQLRFPSPLLEIRLLKNPVVTGGLFFRICIQIVSAACLVAIPFFCQTILHFSPLETGYLMLAFAAALFICGPLSGLFTNLVGFRCVLSSGAMIACISLAILSLLTPAKLDQWRVILQLIVALFLMGIAMGSITAPNNKRILSNVPANHRGAVSAITWFVILLGNTIGATYSSLMIQDGIKASGLADKMHAANLQPFFDVFSTTFKSLIILGLIAFLLAIVKYSDESRPQTHQKH